MDPTAQFKENQKGAWSTFGLFESMTGTVAPRLVSFAGIKPGASVLDVGCGTGVVGLTAARLGGAGAPGGEVRWARHGCRLDARADRARERDLCADGRRGRLAPGRRRGTAAARREL